MIHRFDQEYLLALSQECGWLSEPGRDAYAADGAEISPELREAAREWWAQYNRDVQRAEVYSPAFKALCAHFDVLVTERTAADDGHTAYIIKHSDGAHGWFVLMHGGGADALEFIDAYAAAELPDLSAVQGYTLRLVNSWEFSFGEVLAQNDVELDRGRS